MANNDSYLGSIKTPQDVITPIPSGQTFPESLHSALEVYRDDIRLFAALTQEASSSANLLERIRTPGAYSADTRMSLLKLFRRCVSLICDTENTKKIFKVSTLDIVSSYGHTFKPIKVLQEQFFSMSEDLLSALAALLAENDNRGQSGYALTGLFFDWFESGLGKTHSIKGPRGAGRDIELSTLFPTYSGNFPCDFVIIDRKDDRVVAVGFARYDSTRGGSQSDDRTGGNTNKVDKARAFQHVANKFFRIIFLADGPGLTHRDTWQEACVLDGAWNDTVRVVTLKLAAARITREWLSI
jgi:hypothetical protein